MGKLQRDEFITNKLKELIHQFEDIKIRYEFKKSTNVHLVEVLPFALFDNNTEYILKECEIQDRFEDLFGCDTDEELLFISDNSLNEIEESEGIKILDD